MVFFLPPQRGEFRGKCSERLTSVALYPFVLAEALAQAVVISLLRKHMQSAMRYSGQFSSTDELYLAHKIWALKSQVLYSEIACLHPSQPRYALEKLRRSLTF